MPFTAQQFFEVFGRYHAALWPAPVFLNALAVLALVLAWRGKAHDTSSRAGHAGYELRFRSLFNEGRGYAFSCDRNGHVDMDTMSERVRLSYLYARTVVGRDFAQPAVEPVDLH